MATAVQVFDVIAPRHMDWRDAATYAKEQVLRRTHGVSDLWLSGMSNVPDPDLPGSFRIEARVSVVADQP